MQTRQAVAEESSHVKLGYDCTVKFVDTTFTFLSIYSASSMQTTLINILCSLCCVLQEQRSHGVIAASAGNHAQALAYHGSELHIPITVVMPEVAPMMKIQMCRQFGANVVVHGKDLAEVSAYLPGMENEYQQMEAG